ncbi:MAG: terminase small subunit [Rhodospirillaceae bacterium]|nr:terminase small subunit [Rhodospirillaceae bacterium]
MREPLRERWRKFAELVCEGASYTSAALASGYSESRARQAGSQLAKRPAVRALIDEIQRATAARNQLSVDGMIAQFRQDREDAKKDGDHNAAVRAGEAMAKIAGLWVDRNQVQVVDTRSDAELADSIDRRLRSLGLAAKVVGPDGAPADG